MNKKTLALILWMTLQPKVAKVATIADLSVVSEDKSKGIYIVKNTVTDKVYTVRSSKSKLTVATPLVTKTLQLDLAY